MTEVAAPTRNSGGTLTDPTLHRQLMLFSVLVTVGFELITLAVRFGSGVRCRFARRSGQRRATILIFQIPLAQVLAQHLRLA